MNAAGNADLSLSLEQFMRFLFSFLSHACRITAFAALATLSLATSAQQLAAPPKGIVEGIRSNDATMAQQPTAPIKPAMDFPQVQLTLGMYRIYASVAANNADREQGLMFRKSLAPNEGMLFVFEENAGHCFWMKNTPIPLSIAFIRQDGTITDLDEMQAETTNNHCPTHNGMYALEMNRGWFSAHDIKPGMQIIGLPQ